MPDQSSIQAPGAIKTIALIVTFDVVIRITWPSGTVGRHDVIVAVDLGQHVELEVLPDYASGKSVPYLVEIPPADATNDIGNSLTLTFAAKRDASGCECMPSVQLRARTYNATVGEPKLSVGAN